MKARVWDKELELIKAKLKKKLEKKLEELKSKLSYELPKIRKVPFMASSWVYLLVGFIMYLFLIRTHVIFKLNFYLMLVLIVVWLFCILLGVINLILWFINDMFIKKENPENLGKWHTQEDE